MAAALRIALVAVLATFAHPSTTAGQPSPQAPPTGLIGGQVVDAGSGKPVPGAFVLLGGGPPPPRVAGSPPPSRPRALTDGDGRFAFRGLAAGTYNVTVSRPGHVDGAYGRRRPEGTTQTLALAPGERVSDITIAVWRQASISGAVVDEAGEPVVGVEVRALRRALVSGRWQFTTTVSGGFRQFFTDDRGAYRIPGLPPGEYVVAVLSTVSSAPASVLEGYRDALQTSANSGDLFAPIFEAGSSGAMPGTPGAMATRDVVLSLQR
ncbi:MAG TPA: carboxypeptidase-like regulatory domain-containing protein, partial [Vicinamibacterales bacterium]